MVVLLAIAVTHGVLPEMLAAVTTFVTFRFVSGGAHSETHEGW